MKRLIAITLNLLLLLGGGLPALAEGPVELRGTVYDETHALIPAATVVLDDGKGTRYTAVTDEQGRYRFPAVKPGAYTISVTLEGFADFAEPINLTARHAAPFDITLRVVIEEQVEVREDAAQISTEPDKNLSAVQLSSKELEALPDDPDELLDTLRQMAGITGEGGGGIYVGGFREDGRLPPKESIQMIRINANPFAAEFNEPGNARIEIITKPGSDRMRGMFRFNFFDESLNARNAFAPNRPPLQIRNYNFNLSGPILQNRWGYFFDFERRENDENAVINALVFNPLTGNFDPFSDALLTPGRMTNFSVRSELLASTKHTLGFQYRFWRNTWENQGIGGFSLPERAFDREARSDTIRFSLTSIASERAVNEFRLELSRRTNGQQARSTAFSVNVLDAFTGGGNQGALFSENTNDDLEFSDNLTYTYNRHTIKAGIRAEGDYVENVNRANFGGSFTFGSDFERDALGNVILDGAGNPIIISSLELYRRVVTGVPGYRPSQFSINVGDPLVSLTQWEYGWFVQDDWKVTDRLTLSGGLRHDFQTQLGDKMNLAPRLGLAWGLDKQGTRTLRAGAGVFYDFVGNGLTLDTLRLNGERQQQFVIALPNFFEDIPDTLDGAAAVRPTIRLKADDLNQPYSIMSTVSYEQRLPRNTFVSVGYTWTRGVHLLRTRNINAPVRVDGELVEPFPGRGPLLQFESTGLSTRHETFVNFRSQMLSRFTVFGRYTLAWTKSDTDSAYGTPANAYDLTTEWGRANGDRRHNLFLGSSLTLPWDVRLSPFIRASSGAPFNILTGRDNNGDTLFSDRPAFGDPSDPEAIVTEFGVFDPSPEPGDVIVPRNFGEGPGFFSVNMSLAKTIGFGQAAGGGAQAGGPRGGGGGGPRGGGPRGGGFGGPRGGGFGGFFGENRYRYALVLSLTAHNLFNRVNERGYNGVLTSSFFGRANSADNARRIELALRFTF